MIPEIGHFALILCLALSIVQGVLPLVGDGIPQPLCFRLKGFHLRQQLRQQRNGLFPLLACVEHVDVVQCGLQLPAGKEIPTAGSAAL